MEMLEYVCSSKENTRTIKKYSKSQGIKIDSMIKSFSPDLIALTCTFTMSHDMTIKVADYIKLKKPKIPIIAGGVHMTNAPEIVLKECKSIDFISLYESDVSFCNLLDYVNKKLSKDNVNQLSTIYQSKYILLDKKRLTPIGNELNVAPDYLNLPLEKYDSYGEIGTFRYWRPKDSKASTSLSNRGCRARCSFCSVRNFNGKSVRSRSPESVVDEIENLVNKHNISHITWLDDDLFYDATRTKKLFDEIVKRDINITWDASNGIIASAAVTSPDLIKSAAESGCIGMYLESNLEILKYLKNP